MIQSLWSAASGMQAQQLKVDTIANNLANVNTTGFKAGRVVFQDLLYVAADAPGAGVAQTGGAAGGRLEVGTGVAPGATVRDMSQGALQSTEQEWDLAIDGQGFFQVKLADGTIAYTRDGSFRLSPAANGMTVVDASGNPLLDKNGAAITLPAGTAHATVDQAGNVSVTLENGQTQTLGQIGIVSFVNPGGLAGAGNNLYLATGASGQAQAGVPGQNGLGLLRQGYIEGSNVQVVSEMVGLIVAQRAYELSSKAVQSSDQMLEIANNLRR